MPILLEEAARRRIPVGLLGGTDETLQLLRVKLAETYPNLEVAYVCSPPFRTLTPEEDRAMVAAIVASGARILFVGLGCPKQEKWMARFRPKLTAAVLIGVGAGFDFLSGERPLARPSIRRCCHSAPCCFASG